MKGNGSPLTAANLAWLEDLHEAWDESPGFGRRPVGRGLPPGGEHSRRWSAGSAPRAVVPQDADFAYKQSRVTSLINGFREVGYIYAHLNPLAPEEGEEANFYTEPTHTYAQLTLAEFGLAEADLETEFSTGGGLSTVADEARRDRGCPAGDLLLVHRGGVPPHPEQAHAALAHPGDGDHPQPPVLRRGEEARDPGGPVPRGGVRALHAHRLHRAEALLPGRRGVGDPRPAPRRGHRPVPGDHGPHPGHDPPRAAHRPQPHPGASPWRRSSPSSRDTRTPETTAAAATCATTWATRRSTPARTGRA